MELAEKTFQADFYDRIRMGIAGIGVPTESYNPCAEQEEVGMTQSPPVVRLMFPIDQRPKIL